MGAGAVGLCALQAALHGGARRVVVVEPDAQRRQLATQLGAVAAIDPAASQWLEAVWEASGGLGPDVTLECSGHVAAAEGAISAVRRGGRAVLVGFPAHPGQVDFAALAAAEKEVIGSLSHVYDEDFAAAVAFLADGRVRVEALITQRLSLDEVVSEGFERLASHETAAVKILVSPAHHGSLAYG
jgi:(R,R)-butanediol dehydrogenase/meso-butanediol dehydrogenase/diacetyl reductase